MQFWYSYYLVFDVCRYRSNGLSSREVISTVAEIEKALQTIPLNDARKVADWLQHYLDEKWDTQIDSDIEAGRLDKVADKAIEDYRAGRVKPLDEVIDQP